MRHSRAGRKPVGGVRATIRSEAYRAPTAVEASAAGARRRGGQGLQPSGVRARCVGRWRLRTAVADAKARSGATQLAHVRADNTFFNILFLFDKACTPVTAKAVR